MFIEKFSPKSSEAFFKFHESVSKNSSLDEKTIELIKIAVSSVLRCKHCTDSHTKKALSLGISPEEITDAMLVSALQAAGTQLYWNKEAFDKYL
ncbi:MAG: carboxymuconolactone decarboxylase family protein [Myxococcota bacterium]